MRINIGGPPVFGRATKEGGGVHDFAFIILEAGGILPGKRVGIGLGRLGIYTDLPCTIRDGRLWEPWGPGRRLSRLSRSGIQRYSHWWLPFAVPWR